eukprot:scaffold13098_cov201-Ochromonas_danica.AAC.1
MPYAICHVAYGVAWNHPKRSSGLTSSSKTTQQSVLDDAHTTTKKIFSSARRCELFVSEASAMFNELP